MSSDQNPSSSSRHETWNTKWADFAIVVETGEEFKCHKNVLAKSSSFFETMLSSDCMETKTNKMEAKDFSVETVSTFLKYLYADLEWVPEHDVYRRKFDKTKVTPELMKMCHMYEEKNLHEECSKYLMENICDANVVGTWIEAERCENEDLKARALKYIAKKEDNIASVPGMNEAYKCPKLMKSIVDYYACHIAENILDFDQFRIQLDKLLDNSIPTQPEALAHFVDDYIKTYKDGRPENAFIRIVTTAVVKSCLLITKHKQPDEGLPWTQSEFLGYQFEGKAWCLGRLLDSKRDRQIQSIYAMVTLMVELEHPKGLLVQIFKALHKNDLVSSETFFAWKKCKNPAHQVGKRVALASTVSFFKYLTKGVGQDNA